MRCNQCVTETQCRARGHIIAPDKGGFLFREGITPAAEGEAVKTKPARYANTQDRIAGRPIREETQAPPQQPYANRHPGMPTQLDQSWAEVTKQTLLADGLQRVRQFSNPMPIPPAPWDREIARMKQIASAKPLASTTTLITNETFARALFNADPDVCAFAELRGEGTPDTKRYARALDIAWTRDEKGWRTRFLAQAERTGQEFRLIQAGLGCMP